jgi:hypothetical protein
MVMISRPLLFPVFTQTLPFLGSNVIKWKSNSVPLVHETASVPNPRPASSGCRFYKDNDNLDRFPQYRRHSSDALPVSPSCWERRRLACKRAAGE